MTDKTYAQFVDGIRTHLETRDVPMLYACIAQVEAEDYTQSVDYLRAHLPRFPIPVTYVYTPFVWTQKDVYTLVNRLYEYVG